MRKTLSMILSMKYPRLMRRMIKKRIRRKQKRKKIRTKRWRPQIRYQTYISRNWRKLKSFWLKKMDAGNECGKITSAKSNLRLHAEIHVGGLSFPCKHCSEILTTRSRLAHHIFDNHRGERNTWTQDYKLLNVSE